MSYLSRVKFTGNGVTTTYNFTFGYINKNHVTVTVDGVNTSFTWLGDFQISISPAPANGKVIWIRRDTPRDTRVVDFSNGSTLGETDLDNSALQFLYIGQEAYDDFTDALALNTTTDVFDADGKRITNLGTPTASTDAVTKAYADTIITTATDWATKTGAVVPSTSEYSSKEYAIGTFVPAGSSKEWATQTGGTVDGSEYSSKEYATGSTVPAGSAKRWATHTGTTVDGSLYSAKKYAQDALDSATAAAASEATATTKANAASTSASQAASSEANALTYRNEAALTVGADFTPYTATGDGSRTSFGPLGFYPSNVNCVEVYVGSTRQTSGYSISTNNVVFSAAPANGAAVWIGNKERAGIDLRGPNADFADIYNAVMDLGGITANGHFIDEGVQADRRINLADGPGNTYDLGSIA